MLKDTIMPYHHLFSPIQDSAMKIDKAYYGTNTTKLDVDIYQFTLGPNTNFANIGPGCIPVMVGTYGSQNNGELSLSLSL